MSSASRRLARSASLMAGPVALAAAAWTTAASLAEPLDPVQPVYNSYKFVRGAPGIFRTACGSQIYDFVRCFSKDGPEIIGACQEQRAALHECFGKNKHYYLGMVEAMDSHIAIMKETEAWYKAQAETKAQDEGESSRKAQAQDEGESSRKDEEEDA